MCEAYYIPQPVSFFSINFTAFDRTASTNNVKFLLAYLLAAQLMIFVSKFTAKKFKVPNVVIRRF